jgi:hypothetical protein
MQNQEEENSGDGETPWATARSWEGRLTQSAQGKNPRAGTAPRRRAPGEAARGRGVQADPQGRGSTRRLAEPGRRPVREGHRGTRLGEGRPRVRRGRQRRGPGLREIALLRVPTDLQRAWDPAPPRGTRGRSGRVSEGRREGGRFLPGPWEKGSQGGVAVARVGGAGADT